MDNTDKDCLGEINRYELYGQLLLKRKSDA